MQTYANLNDKKLIAGCLQHRGDCQKLLYDRYSRQMYSICLRYHKDRHMANEALQRGFITVFEKLSNFTGSGDLGGWIRTIIVRKCIDVIKEQKNLKYEDLEKLEQYNNDWDIIDSAYEQIQYSEIAELLDTLPLGYKTVFSMYVMDGIKHNEIAESLDISVATSRSQLYKARKMMLELVQDKFKNSRMHKSQL